VWPDALSVTTRHYAAVDTYPKTKLPHSKAPKFQVFNCPGIGLLVYLKMPVILVPWTSHKNSVVEPEPQGAASFGRSRNAMQLRLRRPGSDNGIKHG
jgi:hypothetical protein